MQLDATPKEEKKEGQGLIPEKTCKNQRKELMRGEGRRWKK